MRGCCLALGLRPVSDGYGLLYCVGGRTAVGIMPADESRRGERFVQTRVGLHHVCFRARERADVDAVHTLVRELGATVVHAPEEWPWAPGYYSVLFEDPDGIRLEVTTSPGGGSSPTHPPDRPADRSAGGAEIAPNRQLFCIAL